MTNVTTFNTTISMTSREIADLTGKRHADVMRDVRKMLTELEIEQNAVLRFDNSGANGRRVDFFELDKDLTMTLVTGYNAKLRMAVIKRVGELEAGMVAITQATTLDEAQELAQRCLAKRDFLRNTYKGEFTQTITESFVNRTSEGGRNVGQALMNHAKLVSLLATGKTPCVFKKEFGMNPRDYALATNDEDLLTALNREEGKVVALSQAGFSYTEIKTMLVKD